MKAVILHLCLLFLGSKAVYRDGTIASDISTSIERNQDYFFTAAQDFSIYLYLPTADETLAGIQSIRLESMKLLF